MDMNEIQPASLDMRSYEHIPCVLLFPLLTDYIQHYVDLTQSNSVNAVNQITDLTPKASSDHSLSTTPLQPMSRSLLASLDSAHVSSVSRSLSGSLGSSSLDSLSSCVQQVLHEGRSHASNMELFAVTALKNLTLIIRLCPSVVDVLVNCWSTQHTTLIKRDSSSTLTTGSSSSRANTSSLPACTTPGTDADDEKSTSSSDRVILCRRGIDMNSMVIPTRCDTLSDCASSLMSLILSLAGMNNQDNPTSAIIIEHSLRVLVELAHTCRNVNQLDTMSPVLGVLSPCLRQEQHVLVTLWSQRLLAALCQSETLMKQICTKCDTCPLYLMYKVCIRQKMEKEKENEKMCLYRQHVLSISDMIYWHASSCSILLANHCPCSDELVTSLILAMDRLLSFYTSLEESDQQPLDEMYRVLTVLASGVNLMLTLAQRDPLFSQHHTQVQMQYGRTLSGISRAFRTNPSPEWELYQPALEELCDFEPDSSAYGGQSQDTDTDTDNERMDIT